MLILDDLICFNVHVVVQASFEGLETCGGRGQVDTGHLYDVSRGALPCHWASCYDLHLPWHMPDWNLIRRLLELDHLVAHEF